MTSPSDEAVMGAIQGGAVEMLGVLFERYSRKALAKCTRYAADRSTAEDLVQEAFLKVLRFRHTFRHDSSFSSWMYRIVHHVCLDHVKSQDRERAAFERLARETETSRGAPWDDDRMHAARDALASLPADTRDLIMLAKCRGLRYAEIAEIVGSTEGAVRVRVHRGLRHLRDRLAGEEA